MFDSQLLEFIQLIGRRRVDAVVDGGHRLIAARDHGDLRRGHHHFVLVTEHLLAVVHESTDDDDATTTAVYDATIFGHRRDTTATTAVTSPRHAYHLTDVSYESKNDRQRTGAIRRESRAHVRLVKKQFSRKQIGEVQTSI